MTLSNERMSAGWTALSRGSWEDARARFTEELEEGESAEALEGLSWAAWWLDDAPAAFDARERAYRRYKNAGDAASAARMAIWLAVDHLDFHGAVSVANGWLQRAGRALAPLDPGPDHGWLAFHEGYLASICDDTAKAAALGARAVELGRQFDVADLEMLGLALQGAILVGCAQVDEGMRYLDEATATALTEEATVPISSAWTCCFLVTACTAVLDYERAFEWCDRIAEFAERYGSRFMLAFCRAEYGEVHRWRGRWAEAERLLESSIEDFNRSRPAWAAAPLVTLAELRRQQGRPADAERLLDQAGASPPSQLCRARLALDRGDARGAAELCERVLRQVPEERQLDRAPAFEVLVRARVGRGELEEAASALGVLRGIERMVATAPLRASTDVAEGIIAAAGGEHERARALFEDALDCFERAGALFEAARARIELATSLAAMGRGDLAEPAAITARDQLVALGAETEAARARRLLEGAIRAGGASRQAAVTPRERDVLAHLAEGLTNREIAQRLVVSEHTVHRHVTNILRKLDLPSRTAAATYVVRSGLLSDIEG